MIKEFTLTRALVELKLYDGKINKAIKELKAVSYSINSIVTEHRQTEIEFIDDYKSQMQKINDLRTNKSNLKNALMKANAETIVKIGDKSYTILEALNKKSDIQTELLLVDTLSAQLNNAVAKHNQIIDKVESDIEKTINSKSSSSGNQSKEYINQIRDSYSNQLPKLVNDSEVLSLINEKRDDIEMFIAEVDFCLSEINALTKIKVELK